MSTTLLRSGAATLAAILLAAAAPLHGQDGPSPDTATVQEEGGFSLPLALRGHATISGDFYHAGRIDARRPGSLYRMNSGARTDLFGGMALNVDLVWSDEGVDFRQNVNQMGINPTWWWGGVHAGDFNLDYSRYLVQGTRVRGGGVMVDPGRFRGSVQAGRLERQEAAAGDDHVSYKRTMVAARAGVGRLEGNHLNVTFLKAWDAVAGDNLAGLDTLVLDTIPVDLRPEVEDRPQDNLAMGVDGQLRLLAERLTLRGEVSASLITRDREASLVDQEGTSQAVPGGGVEGTAGELGTVRISTALDYAYTGSGVLRFAWGDLNGSYEHVGPGYGALGVPYLLNDRRSWDAGGSFRVFQGRLAVQGKYLSQTNNLESQRRNTVDRNTVQLMVAARATRSLTLNLSGMHTTMVNDATDDWDKLDNATLALNTGASWRHELFGLRSSLSLEYGFQETESRDTWIGASKVTTNKVSGSYRVTINRAFSVSPKVSWVETGGTGIETRENLRLGFTGTGRFLDGSLRTNASVAHTTSQGRDVFGARFKASYPVVWGTELGAQLRHQRYTAFGQRPAFDETFLTLSLTRSF